MYSSLFSCVPVLSWDQVSFITSSIFQRKRRLHNESIESEKIRDKQGKQGENPSCLVWVLFKTCSLSRRLWCCWWFHSFYLYPSHSFLSLSLSLILPPVVTLTVFTRDTSSFCTSFSDSHTIILSRPQRRWSIKRQLHHRRANGRNDDATWRKEERILVRNEISCERTEGKENKLFSCSTVSLFSFSFIIGWNHIIDSWGRNTLSLLILLSTSYGERLCFAGEKRVSRRKELLNKSENNKKQDQRKNQEHNKRARERDRQRGSLLDLFSDHQLKGAGESNDRQFDNQITNRIRGKEREREAGNENRQFPSLSIHRLSALIVLLSFLTPHRFCCLVVSCNCLPYTLLPLHSSLASPVRGFISFWSDTRKKESEASLAEQR